MLRWSPTSRASSAWPLLLALLCLLMSCDNARTNGPAAAAAASTTAPTGTPRAEPDPYAAVNTVAEDRSVWQRLLSDHRSIVRVVTYTPTGVEATTESLDPTVRARIVDHARAMQERMKAGAPVRIWDPVFSDLFDAHASVKLEVSQTELGVRIVESSADPDVVALLWSHAAGVSDFVRDGHRAGRRSTHRIAAASEPPPAEVAIGGSAHRILLAQPTASQLSWLRSTGAGEVLNLRKPDEHPEYDESAAAEQAGLDYCSLPYRTLDELTDEVFDTARRHLRDADNSGATIVLHCRTGNRVAPLWAAYRVLDRGVSIDRALFEARSMRMSAPGTEERIRSYIASQRPGSR